MTQKELFETFMLVSHGHTYGTIKGAAINLLIAILCKNSSNVDEAIIQFNELGLRFEIEIRKRFSGGILRPDDHNLVITKLNGDR